MHGPAQQSFIQMGTTVWERGNAMSSEDDDGASLARAKRGSAEAGRLDAEEYQQVLGEELRELRNRRGWTRKELSERLDSEISQQTLATYELGTRHCSVVRLVELCLAMDEQPPELLARVQRRLFPQQPGGVRVRLQALAELADPEFAPLRRWSQGRLRQAGTAADETAADVVLLDPHAIHWLAQLCGMDAAELATRLRDLG